MADSPGELAEEGWHHEHHPDQAADETRSLRILATENVQKLIRSQIEPEVEWKKFFCHFNSFLQYNLTGRENFIFNCKTQVFYSN